MISFLLFIGILGLLFGSLSTVLVERWKEKKGGILLGRSECPKCRKTLSWYELIPLLSYLLQRGKCRHCHTKISYYYPLSETLMASGFILVSYAYVETFGDIFSLSSIALMFLAFVTIVYILYDLRYKEIPDQIMVPAIFGYLSLLIGSLFIENIRGVFFDFYTYTGGIESFFFDHIVAAWILYSFFYLQILIPGGWYLAKRGKMKDLLGLIAGYIIFPFELLFSWTNKKADDTDSDTIPTWVGGGDLRVALFIGLTLGTVHGISSFAFAYIFGSIYGVCYLMLSRKKSSQHQIAFGPFLGLGWFLSLIFYETILEFGTYYGDTFEYLINVF